MKTKATMRGKFLGTLGSGERVFRGPNCHTSGVMLDHLRDVLPTIHANNETQQTFELEAKTLLGGCDCVETNADDDVVYAVRRGTNDRWVRLVKNRQPEPTRFLFLAMRFHETPDEAILLTAFLGRWAPCLPSDRHCPNLEESRTYWATRALVYGSIPVRRETETTRCPW